LQQYYIKLDEKEKNRKLNELLDNLEFNQVLLQAVEGELGIVIDIDLQRVAHKLLADGTNLLGEGSTSLCATRWRSMSMTIPSSPSTACSSTTSSSTRRRRSDTGEVALAQQLIQLVGTLGALDKDDDLVEFEVVQKRRRTAS
jgi:hypothetical protein